MTKYTYGQSCQYSTEPLGVAREVTEAAGQMPLGNFSQTLSHPALVTAALDLRDAERDQ